jgi:pSer/pThr/pTyr-binding forkhead associated (FHA) protein
VTSAAGDGTADSGELRLEATMGRAAGFSLVVRDRLVIGRNSPGVGSLADDPELSRDHAEIARAESGGFAITDLSSTNGTFVNGVRLQSARLLRLGDEIGVGGTTLVVRSVPDAAVQAPPEVDVRAATIFAPTGGAYGQRLPEPPPTAGRGPFEVRLMVDFDTEVAQLAVYGRGEPIRLELEHGRWRVRTGGS